MTNRP